VPMYSYVNHQAMSEVFAPVEVETNPHVRGESLVRIYEDFADHFIDALSKTCWELKHREQWNTGQIAETLKVSERRVKFLIRHYVQQTGEWNPLDRPKAAEVIDISHLVRKRTRPHATPPTHNAEAPAETSHPTEGQASHS
jgi:hypothetical protein